MINMAERLCLETALRMLSRRDHGIQELCKKLQGKGFSTAAVEAALAECIRMDYLNDERFAAAVVRSGQRQGYGPHRIARNLKTKGMADDLVARILAEHFDPVQQVEICRQALGKKMRASSCCRADAAKYKAHLFRFLYTRGFSVDIIRQAMPIHTD